MSSPLLALLALGLTAAEPASGVILETRLNSVSLEVPSLLWNAVELVGERFVHPHLSVLAGFGTRTAGAGDFSTVTLSAGVGLRVWLNRFRFFSDLGGPAIGVRADAAWGRITSRLRGTTVESASTTLSARLAYRFVISRRVEVTPEAGLAVSIGLDRAPWLAAAARPSLALGLTVGYLF